jgi:RsiW-degrading membrane proteinase PrsW (M82 family)
MSKWKDVAEDIVIIYVLMLAVLLIIGGALFAIPTCGCSIIIIIPGVIIIWIALQKKFWLKPELEPERDIPPPPPQYPQEKFYQKWTDFGLYKKGYFKKLNMPSFKVLLTIFLLDIIIGAILLLTIESWYGTFAWVPFVFIFVIAFSFPSFLWISFVYREDVFTPEPARNIMIVLTWGMLSVIPAIIGEVILESIWISMAFAGATIAFLGSTVNAPFVEELCKPFGLRFVKNDINTKLDGLIYGVTAGMGFAMIENLLYEFSVLIAPIAEFIINPGETGELAAAVSSSWALTSLVRGLGSTIGHAVGAGMIGMAYFEFRRSRGNILPLISAFSIAVILHMTWNGTLSVIEMYELDFAFLIGFIILFPILELIILNQLIKIARSEEPELQRSIDSGKPFERTTQASSSGDTRAVGGYGQEPVIPNVLRCPRCYSRLERPKSARDEFDLICHRCGYRIK